MVDGEVKDGQNGLGAKALVVVDGRGAVAGALTIGDGARLRMMFGKGTSSKRGNAA